MFVVKLLLAREVEYGGYIPLQWLLAREVEYVGYIPLHSSSFYTLWQGIQLYFSSFVHIM